MTTKQKGFHNKIAAVQQLLFEDVSEIKVIKVYDWKYKILSNSHSFHKYFLLALSDIFKNSQYGFNILIEGNELAIEILN